MARHTQHGQHAQRGAARPGCVCALASSRGVGTGIRRLATLAAARPHRTPPPTAEPQSMHSAPVRPHRAAPAAPAPVPVYQGCPARGRAALPGPALPRPLRPPLPAPLLPLLGPAAAAAGGRRRAAGWRPGTWGRWAAALACICEGVRAGRGEGGAGPDCRQFDSHSHRDFGAQNRRQVLSTQVTPPRLPLLCADHTASHAASILTLPATLIHPHPPPAGAPVALV